MAVQMEKRIFNVSEYYCMAEAGIFAEDDRLELIEGEILQMSPIGSRHAACVDRLTRRLIRQSDEAWIVRVQSPVRLSDWTEPEPDITLLRWRDDFYEHDHPTPQDVLLIMEVADTSLGYDREKKIPIYAKAGIPEVWPVDLVQNCIVVYSRLQEDIYQSVQQFSIGEIAVSMTLPQLRIEVDSILG